MRDVLVVIKLENLAYLININTYLSKPRSRQSNHLMQRKPLAVRQPNITGEDFAFPSDEFTVCPYQVSGSAAFGGYERTLNNCVPPYYTWSVPQPMFNADQAMPVAAEVPPPVVHSIARIEAASDEAYIPAPSNERRGPASFKKKKKIDLGQEAELRKPAKEETLVDLCIDALFSQLEETASESNALQSKLDSLHDELLGIIIKAANAADIFSKAALKACLAFGLREIDKTRFKKVRCY
jgi:hypothetical protein